MSPFLRGWLSPAGSTGRTKSAPYYNTHEAKTIFSQLLRRVRAGEVVVIAHAGHPVAKLVPFKADLEVFPGIVRLGVYVDGLQPDDNGASDSVTPFGR